MRPRYENGCEERRVAVVGSGKVEGSEQKMNLGNLFEIVPNSTKYCDVEESMPRLLAPFHIQPI